MNQFRFSVALAVGLSSALTCTPAWSFFHLWRFTEFFSNADGSVQFIELRTTSNGENRGSGAEIRSLSTGNVFTFPSNLSSSSTANKNLLIATAGFGSLPGGIAPDFTLPSTGFFNPAGDTVSLVAGFTIDSRTFSSVPTDGVMSRHYPSNSLAVNSPANFLGASGSINLAAPALPGDFTGNATVEQADLDLVLLNWGAAAEPPPLGWINDLPTGLIDQQELDAVLLNWGNTAAAGLTAPAVPEPSTFAVMILSICAAIGLRRR